MFWNRAREVRETLLTATRTDGTIYSLVLYEDEGLGIARDGVPLPPFYWGNAEMDECMETFMRLAGLEPKTPRIWADTN
jgi:hypothetical protein